MANIKLIQLGLAMLLGAGGIGLGAAEPGEFDWTGTPTGWVPVDLLVLANSRGGFEVSAGLTVSFGFLRSVSINGELVSSAQFNLPDVSRISAEQARAVTTAMSEGRLVQVGAGNSVDAVSLANLSGATVIQNSLNDQLIQTTTIINTGVNSQSLFKAVNVQSVLNDALLGALTRR
ncbi:hypothetical protein [Rhodoferax sp. PAMC 29310]|uniref:hypothetical protein n=1 Tax=Rhodoferax sp. PAMC 29310 TaxID=2822760 RepID=UPI001B32D977|nr:hypothetical protein [Rhodoferax sp. PAMC 29310]